MTQFRRSVPGTVIGVNILYGSAAGITMDGNHMLHQNLESIPDAAAPWEHFGYALTPFYPVFTGLFHDDFESGDTSRWSSHTW